MFLRLHDLQVHYKIFGTGQSIVFLSGWGASLHSYARLHEHLAKRFKVFTLDLPGFGLSSIPNSVWGTKEYAELAADFISVLKIQNPIIIGHSFGGKIAIYLAANKLVLPKKIVLISSAGIKLPKPLIQYCKIYCYKIFKKIANLPILQLFLFAKLAEYKNKIGSEDYRNAHGIMRLILVKLINEDFRALLPLITTKTLLIWGDKDKSTPLLAGNMMHVLLSNSHLEIINGAGHFPYFDNFAKFVEILDNFL